MDNGKLDKKKDAKSKRATSKTYAIFLKDFTTRKVRWAEA